MRIGVRRCLGDGRADTPTTVSTAAIAAAREAILTFASRVMLDPSTSIVKCAAACPSPVH